MCSLNLLIVDEDGSFAEATAACLRVRGFAVDCVCSGSDAVKRLEEDIGVDVICVVAGIPEDNSIATLALLRNHFPLVEIIMLSAHATVHSAIEAMKMGAIDYLNTSCDLEQLIGRVTEAGSRKRQRESEILDIRMRPYLTDRARREMIAEVLGKRA